MCLRRPLAFPRGLLRSVVVDSLTVHRIGTHRFFGLAREFESIRRQRLAQFDDVLLATGNF